MYAGRSIYLSFNLRFVSIYFYFIIKYGNSNIKMYPYNFVAELM